MKFLAITVLALAPSLAWAGFNSDVLTSCTPLKYTVTGEVIRHGGSISLNIDGSWSIPDWRVVDDMAALPADSKSLADLRCFGRALLADTHLWVNNAPNKVPEQLCRYEDMRRVAAADPVVQTCYPPEKWQ